MIIFRSRASGVLFDFLVSNSTYKKFLIPCNICPIVPLTFLKANIEFEFIDISKQTLCMDFEIVLNKIKKNPLKYKGILFSHTYGVEKSFDDEFRLVKELNDEIIIIDDRCLCMPDSKKINYFADLTLYSTGYSKYVDVGVGGFGYQSINNKIINYNLNFNKNDLDSIIIKYKKSIESKQEFCYKDSNWLDNKIPAIPFYVYMNSVEEKVLEIAEHKRIINYIYRSKLPKEIQLSDEYQNWRFNISVSNKKELLGKIFSKKLFASSHYEPLNKTFSNSIDTFYNASKLHENIINLFNDIYITTDQAQYISEIINEAI